MAARQSLRESLRLQVRDHSLLAVAGALALFGIVVANNVIPNYHEQAAMEARRAELRTELAGAKQQRDTLRGEVEALDDPYFQVRTLIEKYGWRYGPPQPPAEPPAEPQAGR